MPPGNAPVSTSKHSTSSDLDTNEPVDSFLPLLVILVSIVLVLPLANHSPSLAIIGALAIQFAGLFAVWKDRGFRIAAIGGVIICVPLRAVAQFAGDSFPILILLSHLSVGVYIALLFVVVLVRVIAHRRVTSHTVIGAICGYVLIGYVFAYAYLVMVFFDPASVLINQQPLGIEKVSTIGQHMSELFYFSFITLTTVGYGDLVPSSPIARSLVILEVLVGQLYLAAFVARLVGATSVDDREDTRA